jgi:hypothetical protein
MVLGERSLFYPAEVLTKFLNGFKVKSSPLNAGLWATNMLTRRDASAVDDSLVELTEFIS